MHILIIDDHPLYIRGIQALLFELDPMIVTSGAGSVEEGLALSKDIEFGLVLLDLKLPGMNDLDALRITKRRLDAIPVVVMSGNENPESIWRAVEMGAAGYIPKDTAQSLTVHALQTVLARGVYLPDDLFGSHPASDGRPLPGFSNRPYLSERQLAVLASLLQGKSNKVIANELQIAEGTVKNHLWSIYQVMGVNSRLQAMAKAHALGLVQAFKYSH